MKTNWVLIIAESSVIVRVWNTPCEFATPTAHDQYRLQTHGLQLRCTLPSPQPWLFLPHCVFNLLSVSQTFDLFFLNLFIYLFLAALGLPCWTRAFSSCGERGLLFVAVQGLLIAVASLVVEHRALGAQASVVVARGLSNCGSWALERRLSSCGARA